MACSKIFSGNFPELTDEIIQYFSKDFSTLYSCILVNRLWCRLAIPLLWEEPFSVPCQHYRCIEIYLRFLKEDGKAKFNEYGINDNLLLSNALFNYPSFIKYLDTSKICYSIVYWVGTLVDKYNDKLGNLVFRSLFEVFIENEGNLHSFKVIYNDIEYFNDNMDLILQNTNLLHNISNLNLNISAISSQNIIPLLKFFCSNCNSISSINLSFFIYNINYRSLIEKYSSQIIISQHNLKKISFGSFDNILYNPFSSLKNSNCSNTLNTIIFYFVDFKNIVSILQEVFDQLNVLESIHILYCCSLNFNFVQQIIKVIKPFKLKSLFMNEIIHIESLILLLQKFSECLENLGFGFMSDEFDEPKKKLFEFIMKYCKNIRYFNSGIPNDNNIYLFIENNQHIINYLTIEVNFLNNDTGYNELSSSVLQNLGQVLPSKLEYLCLTLSFRKSDLEIFLKNSKNTFIKKLLIRNIKVDEDENILFCMKKYIMKEKRVKYLAILEPVLDDIYEKELFYYKDKVNEFKLHNIIVQKYDDLYITEFNFVYN